MESVCEELGIPKAHIKETARSDRFVLIVDKSWLKYLEQKKKIIDFPTYHNHNHTIPEDEHPWAKVHMQIYKKHQRKVVPLPKKYADSHLQTGNNSLPMTYSQMVSYVTNVNFKNLWEDSYKKYNASHVKFAKQTSSPLKNLELLSPLVPYDIILRELIQRMFNCCIIHSKLDRIKSPVDPNLMLTKTENHPNIMPALAAIETSTHISVIFYPPALEVSLSDCITYSPAILNRSHNKPLFIMYQIFQLTRHLHDVGLLLGDLRLQDIFISNTLWLQLIPNLESNIIEFDMEDTSPSEEELSENTKFDLKFAFDVEQFSLREYCEMWCNGQLSNFDYLTILNNAAGRRIGSPEYHHIMPWVTDFSQRNGMNWRDLTKSKYRLNKGDPHLDLMFSSMHTSSSSTTTSTTTETPHHVSDFLSEITYFVYMARRTPQHILCQHVRPIWVPAEYPVSIQRLQEWTPDECIPEFYSDPMVFKSLHEDLPDLELPTWASCPEDFIVKHREALESQYVSERLNYWIDLNFGYKLTGKAAIKSKNVCLSLVDNHKNLCQRGIVQLFTQPHPPKRFPSPWFGKNAPRVSSITDQKRRWTQSIEDISSSTINIPESIVQTTNIMERSSSFYTNTPKSSLNTIYLPKDYNPISLIQNLENMETFLARTFLSQKSENCQAEKLANQDFLFEDSENSFTNQMFMESLAAGISKNDKKSNKSRNYIVHQNKHKNVKQILKEKRENELQVIGCIIIELFLGNKLRPLTNGITSTSLEQRLESCKIVASNYIQEIPKCLQHAVNFLLGLSKSAKMREKVVTEKGLPPPTAHQILEPILSNLLIPFPTAYFPIYTLIKSLHLFDFDSILLDLYTHIHCNGHECYKYAEIDRTRVLFSRKIAECKVNACCAQIENLLKPVAYEQQFSSVELLLPYVINLLKNEDTSILTAWHLFDPIATALGIKETQKHLLEPILKLFDTDLHSQNAKTSDFTTSSIKFTTSSSFKSRKSVKLYHHSFLLRLIVRFGLKCFLDNFIPSLIEAVGGYKEPENSSGLHHHSNKNTNFRSSRSNKNLKFCCSEESDNSLTLISPKSDRTLSFDTSIKPEVEDVFAFDDDVSDRIIDVENKSVDSFEIPATNAEEAVEDALIFSVEKQALNDIIYGSQNLSNNSFEDDTNSINSKSESLHNFDMNNGPKSPTIPIPNTFRKTYELSTNSCEIGSKKSQDSFDFSVPVSTNDEDTKSKSEMSDSLQASIISKMSESKESQNNRISEMSTESLIRLSQLLGPILTARYITRNLLRMLSLCYISQENLLPENYDAQECENLNYFSIADSKVVGDRNAARVLESLAAIAALFGEQFILLQYFPHVGELIALCRKRITPSLEGALISSLQLLKYLVPCLVDVTIMEHLKDIFLGTIINPIISVLGSTKSIMPSGYLGRSVLARKLLDAVYVLAVRIGPEMSKDHLCIPAIERFFLIFDKAYYIIDNFDASETKTEISYSPPGVVEELENFDFHLRERAMEEIRDVFSPSLAHCSYLAFLRFFGESIMLKTVKNLEFIMTLCHEYEQPDFATTDRSKRYQGIKIDIRRPSDEEFVGSNSFGTPVIGNRIEVPSTSSRQEIGPMEVLNMVASKFDHINTTRYLKGNWLAYWRHEISRSEKDNHMSLKQIKLQTFAGHTNSVRAILSLDNENSFMSASKDKTVKLWSLRSEGDGRKISSCQFTYNSHKKSVHSLAFLESLRFIVSCDSGIHLWDPFIGRPLGVLDSHKYSPVTVVRTFPSPSPLVLAGTAESSVKIMDCRIMEYVNEWRVSSTQSSTVRCLACAPSGNWIAVGLSSGNIILLDARTGIVMASWRATDGELLQLVAANDNQIISSSLDHSISVWNINDNSLQYQLKQPPEPAHCLQSVNSEIVFATPANRIGIYSDITSRNGTHTITRLRSETLKGMLTSFAVLPLNRTILTGNDSGNIVLLC